jgi:hypothetical protein
MAVPRLKHFYAPLFMRSIADLIDQKDTLPFNRYEENGAVVLCDRRGTVKTEIPEVSLKGETLTDAPLAISSRPSAQASLH